MRKNWWMLLLFACVIGCSKQKEKPQSCIVKISIGAPIRSLDPRVANEHPSAHVIRMLFDGLMRLGPDGSVVPGVAEWYEISEDQMTYTFHLRDSKWTNGDPVTAYDFEYAWKKAVTPGLAQGGAFTFYTIRNVALCLEGKVDVDQVGIRAVDEKTLVVDLEHPASYFLYLTSCTSYAPINKKVALKGDGWALTPGECVSNGPFSMKEWHKNDFISLEKNPSYWDNSEVHLSGINIQIVPDTTTQFYMYEQGDLDWVGGPLSPMSLDILSGQNVVKHLHHIESAGITWLFVNTQCFPYTNKNFRKALALSINRQEIVDHILQMGERSAMGVLGAGLKVQEGPYFVDGDLKQARQCFEQALKELNLTREILPRLVISCRHTMEGLRFIQAIQQQWYEALGIRFEIEQSEWPIHFNNLSKGNYQIGEMGWISWLRDPAYMLGVFRRQGLNMSKWESATCTDYLNAADHEIDEAKRTALFQKAESLLMDEMPVIPINFKTVSYLKNPHLQGVYVSSLHEIDFKWAYFSFTKGESQ